MKMFDGTDWEPEPRRPEPDWLDWALKATMTIWVGFVFAAATVTVIGAIGVAALLLD
jgi:hypothetical protein